MIVQRFLAAVAVMFLGLAVALGTYGARDLSLEFALRRMDRTMLDWAYVWVTRTFGLLAWTEIVQPVLVRPAWATCAVLGVLLMGLVLSISYWMDPRRRRRR